MINSAKDASDITKISRFNELLARIHYAAKRGLNEVDLFSGLYEEDYRPINFIQKDLDALKEMEFNIIRIPRFERYGFLWSKTKEIEPLYKVTW
jgi:hypothetical protein